MEIEIYENNLSDEIRHYLHQHSSHSVYELITQEENKITKCTVAGKFCDINIDWDELINLSGYRLFTIYTYDNMTEVLISSYQARKYKNILDSEYLQFKGKFIDNLEQGWLIVNDIDIC